MTARLTARSSPTDLKNKGVSNLETALRNARAFAAEVVNRLQEAQNGEAADAASNTPNKEVA
jgi:hypothetical protein